MAAADRAGQQCRHLAQAARRRADELYRHADACLARRLPGQLLRPDHAGARPVQGTGRGKGSIVNVTSIAGTPRASLRRHSLCDVEGGAGLADARDGADFGPHGIRVNAIAPGEIDTAILSPGTDKIVETIPLRRLGATTEVADIIYFLCSPQASYVTGGEIHINGGQHV
jgi:NAD(P)-dependent dehydrogenase (short-subunit alcohol dehydrogenase family)